ncbi:MAG: methionine--tRNA ligase [Bacillota bacterium]
MDLNKEKFYITTPIYYPSGKWHLGHCYTTVSCDALAKFHRMDGKDVFFLTGTDEHGQKVQDRAKTAGVSPKEFVDVLVGELVDIFKLLEISNDKFIRTTDEYHVEAVQKIFKTLYEKGDIYKSEYEGFYCKPCESFWTETQLKDGKCPDCGREVSLEKEESYFFRLSKYGDKIMKLYEENPLFINPKSRENEMVNNFIKPGLQDICVSRTTVKWGVEVDFDPAHTVYVWIDALTNYITALGYGSDDTTLFERYWPADLHMMGKEIVRFHSIIWPAILMALDIPLPKRVFGHGWLLIGGDKMSKSKMDKVRNEVVDPYILAERYGVDAVRYFLLREVPFGNDGSYTNEALLQRINTDLANSLGNLVQRTVSMSEKYFGGVLARGEKAEIDDELISAGVAVCSGVKENIEKLLIPQALTEIFGFVSKLNKYIDETTPWVLAKDESKKARLSEVIYNLCEGIRIVATMLMPFFSGTSKKIFECFGLEVPEDFADAKTWGVLADGLKLGAIQTLFPRIDIPTELDLLDEIGAAAQAPKEKIVERKEEITIDDFAKVQLVTAEVIECEKVPKADKLLKLTAKIGGEVRTIVSGIAKAYSPEEMVGKKVVIVFNLKKAKLRGIESDGMILCAEDENGELSLVAPEKDFASGCEVR